MILGAAATIELRAGAPSLVLRERDALDLARTIQRACVLYATTEPQGDPA